MPKIAIHEPEADINYIPFVNPKPKRTIGLVWRKTSTRSQLMNRVISLLTEVVFSN